MCVRAGLKNVPNTRENFVLLVIYRRQSASKSGRPLSQQTLLLFQDTSVKTLPQRKTHSRPTSSLCRLKTGLVLKEAIGERLGSQGLYSKIYAQLHLLHRFNTISNEEREIQKFSTYCSPKPNSRISSSVISIFQLFNS